MKIQYLSTLAIVSLLSIGTIAGCSSPAKNDTSTSPSTTVQADSKANPCAAKANPCAAKANPCAAKANPCAAKANPCASKAKTVGGPLAQKLQGKPVLVDIYASWCPACKNIAPTLSQLGQQYAGKVEFVVLDVSDKATTAQAEAKAKELGLSDFLDANKAQTGTVTIVNPATGQILAQHRNNANLADYTTVLDTALKQ
jgi:thiol-disulfide isomerase/thioredoxin